MLLISCGGSDNDSSAGFPLPESQEITPEFLVDRNDVIWGFDFLPDGRILFTERSGRLFLLSPESQEIIQVEGAPSVRAIGEGGLMDLKLHPNFATNSRVYICYTPTNGRAVALGRGTLEEEGLTNVEQIFQTQDANSASIHFGCRIEFQNSDRLFLSVGDQNNPSQAQSLNSHLGKILRLNAEGDAPADNPFSGTDALPEIWSLGHRNPQGLAVRPGTDQLFSSEHGPTGGDELNIILPGENYGWPLVTAGEPAGELGESSEEFVDPILTWTPAIAPSGMTFYQGDLFIATLRGRHIRRISLSGDVVSSQGELVEEGEPRFRNVSVGPDGFLYFSTDDGKIGRVNF